MKKKLNKIKNNMKIKKKDKMLLFIKNLINNKLNNFYIEAFKIKNVRNIITLLILLNIKIFLKFYTLIFKKLL